MFYITRMLHRLAVTARRDVATERYEMRLRIHQT